jgi:hypothetical protein
VQAPASLSALERRLAVDAVVPQKVFGKLLNANSLDTGTEKLTCGHFR